MIDDILYDPITPPEGSQRKEIKQIDDHITVEYTVTIKDGQEQYEVTTITVTSNSKPMNVTVDGNIVVKPPAPPVYDDGYYVPADFNFVGCI